MAHTVLVCFLIAFNLNQPGKKHEGDKFFVVKYKLDLCFVRSLSVYSVFLFVSEQRKELFFLCRTNGTGQFMCVAYDT